MAEYTNDISRKLTKFNEFTEGIPNLDSETRFDLDNENGCEAFPIEFYDDLFQLQFQVRKRYPDSKDHEPRLLKLPKCLSKIQIQLGINST